MCFCPLAQQYLQPYPAGNSILKAQQHLSLDVYSSSQAHDWPVVPEQNGDLPEGNKNSSQCFISEVRFLFPGPGPGEGRLLSFQEMLQWKLEMLHFFQLEHVFFKNIILSPTHTNFRIRPKPSYCPLFLLGKYYIYSRCRSASLQTSDCFRKTNLL